MLSNLEVALISSFLGIIFTVLFTAIFKKIFKNADDFEKQKMSIEDKWKKNIEDEIFNITLSLKAFRYAFENLNSNSQLKELSAEFKKQYRYALENSDILKFY